MVTRIRLIRTYFQILRRLRIRHPSYPNMINAELSLRDYQP